MIIADANVLGSVLRFEFFLLVLNKYINNNKVGDLVEGDPKAPFSIATTTRCKRRFTIPWIAPLYPLSLPYNAECYAGRHQVSHFESLV